MPSATDSERRKARDAALRTQDKAIGEYLEQARCSGELQSVESFGKPIPDADGWHETLTEFRLPLVLVIWFAFTRGRAMEVA